MAAPAFALNHEAYVWQRHWTGAVGEAIRDTQGVVTGWRVLAAETDRGGRLRGFAVDWTVLAGKPLTAVVRIDGTLQTLDTERMLADLRGLMAHWPHGAGLEIDFDCATARLGFYTAFLARVRALHPAHLSITALPTWLGSSELGAVLARTDEAVLQVHAVRSPSAGLFDVRLARRWIDTMDGLGKPFRVALPDYGTAVIRSEGGAVIALESESPKLIGGASADELVATPGDVAALLADLGRRPPRHMAGVVWFRLPVEGDRRIWSRATLAAVIAGKPSRGRVALALRDGAVPGAKDIVLMNEGDTDTPLPAAVRLPPACRLADGIGAYRYDAAKNALVRLQNALIGGHHSRLIGWARCSAAEGDYHVEP